MVVIVVPECRSPPGVRIFVAARISWSYGVRGESVELRTSDPAVQVNDAGLAEAVCEGHNRGSVTTGSDSRAGEATVVSKDTCARARDYLGPRLALDQLVVIGGGVGPRRIQNRWR